MSLLSSRLTVHYMDTKAASSATEQLIEQTVERLSGSGQWSELARFLENLRKVGDDDTPQLKVWQAEVALRLGSPHETVALANQLLASPGLPMRFKGKALLLRSSAARLRGFLDSAEEDARAALKVMEDEPLPLELRIEAHRQLGAVLGTMGRLDESVQELEKGLRLCAKSSDLVLMAGIEDNLAASLAQLGQLPPALVYFERAKAAYKKTEDTTNLARVLNNIGRLYYLMGQYDSAIETLREGKAAADASKSIRIEGSILVNLGDALQQMSQHTDALNCYNQALGLADQVLEPRLSCQANIGMGTAYCALEDLDKAHTFLRKAVYESERLGLELELSVALLNLGILDMRGGHHKDANDHLTGAVTNLQTIGARRDLLKGYLYLALLCFKTRRWANLRRYLELVGKMVHELDMKEQLLVEAREIPEIIEYAASKRICGLLFQEIRGMLRGRPRPSMAEAPFNRMEGDTGSGWPSMEVRSLGDSLVLLDSRRTTDAEWRSQKAKELFLYLLCHARGATREQLLEVLWPDFGAALSRNALYNNVYRVRKALYEEIIVHDGQRYKIKSLGPLSFDLEEFHDLIERANKLPSGSGERAEYLKRAVQIYKGSFLEEFYAEWCDAIRFQAEALYMQSLARLAGFCSAHGQYDLALEYLEKLLAVDETNPAAHEQMIKILIKKGESVAAYERYARYQAILEEDMVRHSVKSFAQLAQESLVAI